MKIATNVNRDAFGGITISNLALFDWLKDNSDTIVGIEIVAKRHILGPVIFRHYAPSFFRHHIINSIDIFNKYPWDSACNLKNKWRVLIDTAKDIMRQEEPDILLINGTYSTPWILAQAARELGIPIVLRYAGVLKKEASHKNFFVRRRFLEYEKWLVGSADAIIFPSVVCQKIVENEIWGHPVEHSQVIPNPVRKQRVGVNKRSGRYTIAAIGRWTPIKNFPAFVKLHKELLGIKWPHKAILVASLGFKNNIVPETIELRDPMSHEDLLKFYRSVDLVAVTSHFETFSNVAAEAVVNGTTVLVSKDVGFSEILIQAGLKRMVIDSFEDSVAVASVVKKLSNKKLSQQETRKVIALLDPQKIHQEILDVLKSVVKKS